MNVESGNIKNYLFIPNNANYAQEFKKFCVECTKQDRMALFITRQSADILPLLSQLEDIGAKEQLKRFIIMYFECIEDVAKKLLELHDWTLMPAVLVLDLHSFIQEYNEASDENEAMYFTPVTVLQSVCLCVATLFSYMSSKEKKLSELRTDSKERINLSFAYSIVLLGTCCDVLTQSQLELLINLYFYDEAAFDDFDEITNKIYATWQ